jgi:ketosteroid isomerase-like protein
MSVEDMKTAIRGVHEAIMKNDADKLISLCADDVIVIDSVGMLKGREGVKRWMKWISGNFPRVMLNETRLIVEGNVAAHE